MYVEMVHVMQHVQACSYAMGMHRAKIHIMVIIKATDTTNSVEYVICDHSSKYTLHIYRSLTAKMLLTTVVHEQMNCDH